MEGGDSCLRFEKAPNAYFLLATQITKAMDISIVPSPAGSRFPYKLEIKGTRAVVHVDCSIDIYPRRQTCSQRRREKNPGVGHFPKYMTQSHPLTC